MDALRAIATKRDTRAYTAEPVTEEELESVLRAARMAGSAKNNQLTRIVVVTETEGRKALTTCGDFTSWIDAAPVVLVFAIPVDGGRLFDVGRMAQNAMVAANALGLASCPVTFQHQDRIREALGLPAGMEGPMGVTLGRPDAAATSTRPRAPRLPLDQIVHRERWTEQQ
ncbi:MAG TPA: nitroreductase [Acidimicrobiales bacterium]|jgi:nitroreductase|nr:nitroreductase [Acidimicrobiales bacterium]